MAAGTEPRFDDESLSIFVMPDQPRPEGAPSPSRPPPARRLSPLRSLRRHWIIALLMLLAVGALAVPLLLYLRIPVYAAEATILVSQTFGKNLSEDREFQLPRFGEFLKQQLVTITREEVAMDALERLGDRRSLWMSSGEGRRDAAIRLSRALVTRQVPETSYISITLEGKAPEGLAEVANAVADAYLSRARGQPFYGMDLRLEALNRHKAQLADEIRAKTELLSRWAKEHGVAGFDVRPNEGSQQEAEKALQAARARRADAESRVAGLDAREEVLKTADLGVEAREALGSDPEFSGLKASLLFKKNEHKTKLTGLTPEHEGRKATEKLIAEIDAEIEKNEKAALERLQAAISQRRDARLKEERRVLAIDLEQARKQENAFSEESAGLARKGQRFNDVYYDAQSVQQEIERLRRQFGAVEDRIDLLRLESYAPGFVHLAAPAMPPTGPVPVKPFKWLALLGALGAGLAVGIPLLIDSLDARVRVPGDLVRELEGCSLVGLPRRDPRTEPFVRDQLRRLALGMDRERRHQGRRRVVFTGVKVEAGTTQITLDVALELRNLGVRALAIEANALKPDARFTTPEGHAGLMDVLRGTAGPASVTVPPTQDLPPRVPVGDTGGRSILSEVSRLAGALSEISGNAEIVLIDAPPVLLSSDAEMLAGMADAVVLVVGSHETSIPEVRRAYRILKQVGTPVVRAIVNRVELGEGGRSRDYAELIKEYNVVSRVPSA